MNESRFNLRIVQPSEPLRRFLSAYYLFDFASPERIEDCSVPEWGNIRVIYAGGFDYAPGTDAFQYRDVPIIQGPSSKAVRFRVTDCSMVGIGVLPEGFARFWKIDLATIADQSAILETVMGTSADALARAVAQADSVETRFAAVDSHFLQLLRASPEPKHCADVARVHALLNKPEIANIEQLAEAARMTPSALARFCKKRFGFPSKLLLRRQRFLRMLEALHARPYAEWPDFLDPQYVDQSHMIRDFKYFMGQTPSQYLAQPRLVQQASAAHRADVFGRALQGLS
jgi:AraC-like DNA-binding protein